MALAGYVTNSLDRGTRLEGAVVLDEGAAVAPGSFGR